MSQRRAKCSIALLATVVLPLTAANAQWSTSSLTTGRDGHCTVAIGNSVYVAGGLMTGNVQLDSVEIYDVTTGTWSLDTLSSARAFVAGATDGTRFYVAGGQMPNGGQSDVVDILDTTTGIWTTATLSVARREMVTAAVGDKVIFAGGNEGSTVSDAVDIFDTTTGLWTTATLSAPRSILASASVGNLAIFAGGFAGAAGPNLMSDAVDIYDASTGAWTTQTLSEARAFLASAVVGQKVLFGGGRDNGFANSSTVDVYDVATGIWSVENLVSAVSLQTAVGLGTKAYFAGGSSSDEVQVFDTATSTWTLEFLSAPRGWTLDTGSTRIGNRAFFVGGSAPASMRSDVVDILDITTPLGAMNYCGPAVVNSSGVSATITATGSGAVADNDLTLAAQGIPLNQFGIFVVSRDQAFVPGGSGPSNGNLCVGGAIGRFNLPSQIQTSGATGTFSLSVDLTLIPQGAGFVSAVASDTWNFQAWFREFGGLNSNLTDAVTITFQ